MARDYRTDPQLSVDDAKTGIGNYLSMAAKAPFKVANAILPLGAMANDIPNAAAATMDSILPTPSAPGGDASYGIAKAPTIQQATQPSPAANTSADLQQKYPAINSISSQSRGTLAPDAPRPVYGNGMQDGTGSLTNSTTKATTPLTNANWKVADQNTAIAANTGIAQAPTIQQAVQPNAPDKNGIVKDKDGFELAQYSKPSIAAATAAPVNTVQQIYDMAMQYANATGDSRPEIVASRFHTAMQGLTGAAGAQSQQENADTGQLNAANNATAQQNQNALGIRTANRMDAESQANLGIARQKTALEAYDSFNRGKVGDASIAASVASTAHTQQQVAREKQVQDLRDQLSVLPANDTSRNALIQRINDLASPIGEQYKFETVKGTDEKTGMIPTQDIVRINTRTGQAEKLNLAAPPQAAIPDAAQRVVGQAYDTPKGKLVWQGNGWSAQ